MSEQVWCTAETQRRIGRRLREQGLVGSQHASFGNLNRPVPQLERDAIWQESVGGLLDPLDDRYAALGRFTLRVVVAGSVLRGQVPVPTMTRSTRPATTVPQYTVQIEQVGFYLFDSYDFNGDQPLGFWSTTGVSRLPAIGYDYVSNELFRNWRAQHGRGGDFLVYSDLKLIRRNPPDSFALPIMG